MPVQMIELEEVMMIETTDDALEAVVGRGGMYMYTPSLDPKLYC
jgi:hypothetical protein